ATPPVDHHGAVPYMAIAAQLQIFARKIPLSCQDLLVSTLYIPWCVASSQAVAGGPLMEASHARGGGRARACQAGARNGGLGHRRGGRVPSTDCGDEGTAVGGACSRGP